MNITTSRARYLLASMLALATIACGGDPCLPTINADTSILPPAEECYGGDDETSTGNSGESSSETSIDPTGGPAVCDAMPGVAWGPCPLGECEEGSFCLALDDASMCMPHCTDLICKTDDPCKSIVAQPVSCNANGATFMCGHECDALTECGDGQVCNQAVNLCMWPL